MICNVLRLWCVSIAERVLHLSVHHTHLTHLCTPTCNRSLDIYYLFAQKLFSVLAATYRTMFPVSGPMTSSNSSPRHHRGLRRVMLLFLLHICTCTLCGLLFFFAQDISETDRVIYNIIKILFCYFNLFCLSQSASQLLFIYIISLFVL